MPRSRSVPEVDATQRWDRGRVVKLVMLVAAVLAVLFVLSFVAAVVYVQ